MGVSVGLEVSIVAADEHPFLYSCGRRLPVQLKILFLRKSNRYVNIYIEKEKYDIELTSELSFSAHGAESCSSRWTSSSREGGRIPE